MILTPDEIEEIKVAVFEQSPYDWSMFASRVQAAVIARLATVSVEPVVQFRGGGCEWFDGHPDESDGDGPYTTRALYTAEALAAVRVQGIEEAAKVVEDASLKGLPDDPTEEGIRQVVGGVVYAERIRALIGAGG